jgi:Ca2+-binding RTX toxin-like protein
MRGFAILGLAASLLVPAAALGTTASYSPAAGLVIEGDATGETLRVQVLDENFRVIKDNGPTLIAGGGCVPISAPVPMVQCLVSVQSALSRTVTAKLGDGADDISFIINQGASPVPATIDGGGGDDTLTSGLRAGPAGGDPSEPPLQALNAAAHVIEGGEGDDVFLGDSGGTDVFLGGPGNDTFRARATARSVDNFIGGAGADVVDYSARADPVSLTSSNVATAPNDGAPGEGDDTGRAETLIGGQGADTLEIRSGPVLTIGPGSSTSPPAPIVQTMRGNGGPDTLTALGDPATTSMDGGTGRDIIRGGSGADTIFSRDGERDKIGCGAGTDVLTSDLKDLPVPADCESVNKSDRREGPNVAVLTRIARVDEAGLLSVRLACPRTLRTSCAGTLVARLERKGARFGARARYSLRPGRSAVVEVALRLGQVTRARRPDARVRVRSTEAGIHGTKTTQRVLEARAV